MLDRVEKQRQALEANVAKLRKSLRHWQSLELDYEGLKEEFELLPQTASTEDCLQTARDFNAVVVDEKDLHELLVDAKYGRRSPQQLANLLAKRVDYVSRNADAVRKQISSEEKKLNALLLIEDPDHREDAGLPLTEITEELDEEGNIISSKAERPGEGVTDLADVLEKAGVEGLQKRDGKIELSTEPLGTPAVVATSSGPTTIKPDIPAEEPSDSDSETDEEVHRKDMSVRVPTPGENLIAVNIRDTQEEAKLRRDMIEYGLDEVGAIVAELDIQENASDVSYDEDADAELVMDSDFEDDDDEGSEDESGRTKNPVISEKYKQKMEELQKKLGLTDLKNLGPTPELPEHIQGALDRPPAAEAARKAALAREEAISKDQPPSPTVRNGSSSKKSVAFAEQLDIANEVTPKTKPESPVKRNTNPVGEAVIERSRGAEDTPPPPPAASTKTDPSRFKAARQPAVNSSGSKSIAQANQNSTQASASPAATRSEDRPLVAPTVLERATASAPIAPHLADIDDDMHRREIAMEYHKLRNRRIHEQGGFVRGHPEEDDELDDMLSNSVLEDPETGEVKRLSRFKAARLMR